MRVLWRFQNLNLTIQNRVLYEWRSIMSDNVSKCKPYDSEPCVIQMAFHYVR
jgi:hypothetical protein